MMQSKRYMRSKLHCTAEGQCCVLFSQQSACCNNIKSNTVVIGRYSVLKTPMHRVFAANNIACMVFTVTSTDCILCVFLDQKHAVRLNSLPA